MSLASLSPVGYQVEVLKLYMGEYLVGFNVMINNKCLSKWLRLAAYAKWDFPRQIGT